MPGRLDNQPWERVSREADVAMRRAFEALYSLRARVEEVAVQKKPISIQQIRADLQASGSTPLNVTQLLGSDSLAAIDQDVHANRPDAATAPLGKLFWETDRTTLYIVGTVGGAQAWVYVAGEFLVTQPNLPTDLATGDTGFIAAVLTDFNHRLRWTGAAWDFAPGDVGGRFITGFVGAPPGGGWQLCDGTATSFLNANGTTTAFTTPNLTGHYCKFAAAYVATAAVSGDTGITVATNQAASAGTPSGTNSSPTFLGDSVNTGPESATQAVFTGAGTTVTGSPHVHSVTPTGAVSAPTFTGNALGTHNHTQDNHTHTPGSQELARTTLIPYMRR